MKTLFVVVMVSAKTQSFSKVIDSGGTFGVRC
jgi:hypothetical protein